MSIDSEKWLTCPYDKSHTFPPSRLQPHILKCARSHPELAAAFVKCKYNATHLILGSEIENHENETCPDRYIFSNIANSHASKIKAELKLENAGKESSLKDNKEELTANVPEFKVQVCELEPSQINIKESPKCLKEEKGKFSSKYFDFIKF